MSDQPMDYADPHVLNAGELQQLLTTLLHAGRAGVRVCLFSRAQAPSTRYKQLLHEMQRNEAKSCRGLIDSMKILGHKPDNLVGDFMEKCLAIEDFDDRLRFLSRGQGWVAKKISDALPRIQHLAIHQQLTGMLEDHSRNLDKVNDLLSQHPA